MKSNDWKIYEIDIKAFEGINEACDFAERVAKREGYKRSYWYDIFSERVYDFDNGKEISSLFNLPLMAVQEANRRRKLRWLDYYVFIFVKSELKQYRDKVLKGL